MTETIQATAHTTKVVNPRLRVLNAFKEKKKPLMTFMAIPSTRMAQIVASTGLEGIIIDCEHGHISDDSMHNAVAAIAAQGVSPLIRIRAPHPDLIKRALDTGAHGIMVPMVNTAAEAQAVVTYSKFPPYGLRGQGSAFPALAHGITIPEYMKTANETLLTCVQIETKEGAQNVEAIAATPGVDCLFIGPNDLAMSVLNYVPARGDEPEFVNAIAKIVAAARNHAKEALETFDSVAITGDTKAIQNWYGAEIEIARA